MKVLLTTDGIYPFVMGGMQKHSFYLAKYLARAGIEVHLVHCTPPDVPVNEFDAPELSGLDRERITFSRASFPASDGLPGHYLRGSRKYAGNIYEAMRDQLNRFDLIYCQGFTGLGFIRGRKDGAVAIPVLSNLHGYEMYQPMPSIKARVGRGLLRRLAREVSLGSDGVFSFGGHISGILERIGVPPQRILECPIGIEGSWLEGVLPGPPGKELNFIFVGRNERRKGIHELNAALRKMIGNSETGFRFQFVGPIGGKDRLKAANIQYTGAVGEEHRIRGLLRASDVLVCPSHAEGMPTVIMEAMASALAVIATDVGAVAKQVDKSNGWLLEAPDPLRVQEAMHQAMTMPPGDILRMKEQSLAKAREHFTWEHVIARKVELMEMAVLQAKDPVGHRHGR